MKRIISYDWGVDPEELEVEFEDGSKDTMYVADLIAIFNEFVEQKKDEQ